MARENLLMSFSFSFRYLIHFTLLLSLLSLVSFLFRHNTTLCSCPYNHNPNAHTFDHHHNNETIDLLRFSSAWNHLTFPSKPKKILKIAVVVKKWPRKSQAGGLERHALTLHLALANRGHEVHVFTAASPSFPEYRLKTIQFHLSEPTAAGYLDQASVSQQLQSKRRMSTPARKRLMRDFKRLQQDPPAGISGALQDNNIMLWNAVIFGPDDTPWDGGTFKLSLQLSEDYPNKQ